MINHKIIHSIIFLELLKWVIRSDSTRVDYLVSQPNLVHLLASQKNSNLHPDPSRIDGLNELAHIFT